MKTIALLTAGLLMVWATQAQAAIVNLNVSLDGLQEAPTPVATPGTGTAIVTVNTVTGAVSVSGSYSSLIGSATAAHIHGLAPVGTAVGVIVPLSTSGGTSGTFGGAGTLTPTQVTGLMSDLTYLNVHSSYRPGGEIRGQIFWPEPTSAVLLSVAGGLALLRRRR